MKRTALFPGSFDPITKGHENIVRRGLLIFDQVIVAVGLNSSKQNMFPIEQKLKWIERTFSDCSSVKVIHYEGLTIECCKKYNAKFILRGLRNPNDYEYEKNIALMNQSMDPDIQTIYLNTDPKWAAISSTIVRDIIKNQGNAEPFLASGVQL